MMSDSIEPKKKAGRKPGHIYGERAGVRLDPAKKAALASTYGKVSAGIRQLVDEWFNKQQPVPRNEPAPDKE